MTTEMLNRAAFWADGRILKDRTWIRHLVICGALILLTWSAFNNVLDNDFIDFDDPEYVTDNPYVSMGLTWESIGWAFTSGHMMNWHPLTWISHMLDVELFGLSPRGHHFTSLLIHILSVLLLFGWLSNSTGCLWSSALAAALFAVHPLRVESVAWIAERKDVLCGLFGILALWAYGFYAQKRTAARYGLVTLSLLLGLMSKAMLITWPLLFLVLDVWPLRRFTFMRPISACGSDRGQFPPGSAAGLVMEKVPWLLMAGATALITLLIHHPSSPSAGETPLFPIFAENSFLSYFRYLGKMVYPVRLSLVYPFRPEFHPARFGLAVLVFGGLSVAAAAQIRKRPWLFTGWFWYVVTLLPVIGFLHAGSQRMADRYTYLPSIGIVIGIAWTLRQWQRGIRWRQSTAGVFAGSVLVLLMMGTWFQTSLWKNSLILFEHSIRVTGDNPTLEVNLAHCLWQRGYTREAIAMTESVLKRHPKDLQAAVNLGSFCMQESRYEQALGYLEKALEVHPGQASILNGYIARVYRQKGDLETAAGYLNAVLSVNPKDLWALNELARIRREQGRSDLAAEIEKQLLLYRQGRPYQE